MARVPGMKPEDEQSCTFQAPETWTGKGVFDYDGLSNFVCWLKQLKAKGPVDCGVEMTTEGGEKFYVDVEEIEEWADALDRFDPRFRRFVSHYSWEHAEVASDCEIRPEPGGPNGFRIIDLSRLRGDASLLPVACLHPYTLRGRCVQCLGTVEAG